MNYTIDIGKNIGYNKGIINIWGYILMEHRTAEELQEEYYKMITAELQEEYYQRITEDINTAGEYFNWMYECVQTPAKDEYEQLAREEYVKNWHQYFMERVKDW